MTPIEKAAKFAMDKMRSFVGYHEKATNSQLEDFTANSGSHNYNMFAAHIDALRKDGYNVYNGNKNIGDAGEWCDISFDDCQIRCWGVETAQKMLYQPWNSCGAGCCYSAGYYRAAGAWYSTPKIGDQIFFGKKYDETHTGGVYGVDDTYVYTVEGNANNQMMERKYKLTDSSIAGYGRPNYALVADRFAEKEPEGEPATSMTAITAYIDQRIEDYMGKMVNTIDDIPWESVREVMRKVLDSQAIDGGTDYETNPDDIGLPLNSVRVLVGAVRYIAYVVREAMDNG